MLDFLGILFLLQLFSSSENTSSRFTAVRSPTINGVIQPVKIKAWAPPPKNTAPLQITHQPAEISELSLEVVQPLNQEA